jgi:enoyl-CoA hydratase/carnithine racemase
LDLHEALSLDRAEMAALMQEFHRTVVACFGYPGPTIAAIGGHAIAGGALLSLACDVRVIADAGISFGIPGIHLGVAYPDVALEVLRAQLAPTQIERVLFDGGRLAPEEAALLEVVEEPVPAERLHEHARQRAVELAGVGLAAYASAKASVRGAALRRLKALDDAGEQSPGAQAWLDVWFSPGTRGLLDAARAGLGKGRGAAGAEASR